MELKERLSIENPTHTLRAGIPVSRLWRDSSLIPNDPPTPINQKPLDEGGWVFECVTRIGDSGVEEPVLVYYDRVPLERIKGTKASFSKGSLLNRVVGDTFGKGYIFKIYSGSDETPYGLGQPILDYDAGVLSFNDPSALPNIEDVRISFYAYEGRLGVEGVESLPFLDTLTHFKSSVNGGTSSIAPTIEGHIKYLLPDNERLTSNDNERVLVTQESIENVIAGGITISGGRW